MLDLDKLFVSHLVSNSPPPAPAPTVTPTTHTTPGNPVETDARVQKIMQKMGLLAGDHHGTTSMTESLLWSRNVKIGGHRTSIRLEPYAWDALDHICKTEQVSLHEILTLVNNHKPTEASVSSATRIFILGYYREALREAEPPRAEAISNPA